MRLLATALLASVAFATPAAAVDFTQIGPYRIPATGVTGQGPTSPYPITFNVTGLTGTITDVNFTLTDFSHTFPNDVLFLLVGPTGANVMLYGRAGTGADVVSVTYVIDQQASQSFSGTNINPSGSYKPTSFTSESLFTPAPSGPYGSSLDGFNGTNPNGAWSLYIDDFASGDFGSLASATLSITTSGVAAAVPEPATWTMMIGGFGLVGGAMRRRRATSAVTYA